MRLGSRAFSKPQYTALARDEAGIALSAIGFASAQVKPLALSMDPDGPFHAPTLENIRDRVYPLHRATWIYFNRAPGRPIEPRVAEFLRYLLSRGGQGDVERDGEYLPLAPGVIREQLERIE